MNIGLDLTLKKKITILNPYYHGAVCERMINNIFAKLTMNSIPNLIRSIVSTLGEGNSWLYDKHISSPDEPRLCLGMSCFKI